MATIKSAIRAAQRSVLACVIIISNICASVQVRGMMEIRPNLELQADINRIASMIIAADDEGKAAEVVGDILRLRPNARDQQIELMQQIADAWARNQDEVEEEGLAYPIILHYLRLDDTSVAEALLPYLHTQRKHLRQVVSEVLAGVEIRNGLTVYSALIEADVEAGQPPNPNAIERMIEANPSEAMSVLTRALNVLENERKEVVRQVHVVDETLWKHRHGFLPVDDVDPDASVALDELSRRPEWWARRYVAEIVRDHTAFRTRDIVERLSRDGNERVRQAVMMERER